MNKIEILLNIVNKLTTTKCEEDHVEDEVISLTSSILKEAVELVELGEDNRVDFWHIVPEINTNSSKTIACFGAKCERHFIHSFDIPRFEYLLRNPYHTTLIEPRYMFKRTSYGVFIFSIAQYEREQTYKFLTEDQLARIVIAGKAFFDLETKYKESPWMLATTLTTETLTNAFRRAQEDNPQITKYLSR